MTYDDLSDGALQAALTGAQATSLVYLFRFFDGFQPGGATAYYEPARGGWRFGETDYQTQCGVISTSTNCPSNEPRTPQGKIQTYEPERAIPGAVDQEAGTIRLSVPRSALEALAPPSGDDPRPTEVPASVGSRIYDAAAWSFSNILPVNDEQLFLVQSDNTASFDFLLTSAGAAAPVEAAQPGQAPPAAPPATGGGRLPATGGLGLPLLAVALVTGALAFRRRRE